MRARFIQFGMVLIGVFFALPVGAVSEQTYDVSQATVQWTDNTHFTPQQYSFVNTQYRQTITLLYDKTKAVSSVIVATSTVNPNPKGIWHGVVTSTVGAPSGTMFATFFASSTQGDSLIHVDAGTQNRFITPNNIGYYVSTNSSSYTNIYGWDQLGYSLNTFSLGSPTQAADLWVNFNGFSAGGSSVSFYTYPTSTCDFNIWPTVSTISNADINEYGQFIAPAVTYGIDPSQQFYLSTVSASSGTFQTSTTQTTAPQGGVVKNTPLLPGYTYTATPYIVKNIATVRGNGSISDSDIVAQGSSWNFIISGQPGANGCSAVTTIYPSFSWPFVTSTPQSSYAQDWCTAVSDGTTLGDVKAAFCSSIQYLFKPSQESVNQLATLQTALSNKPPFGYVTVYSNALNGFASSTTATSTVDISSLSQIGFIGTLRTVLSWIVYVLFGLWVFNRFRHFSLMG